VHGVAKTKGAATRVARPGAKRAPGAARAKRGKPTASRVAKRAAPDPDPDDDGAERRLAAPPAARDDEGDDNDDNDDDDARASDEPLATRDIGRLLRYGERIGGDKIDVRMLPLQLHARSGALAVCDPARPDTWRVLDRPVGSGAFRVMLSIARPDDGTGGTERLAAAVIHVGRPPIARWTVAQFRGQPRAATADAVPRTTITGGWLALVDAGDGSPGVIALPPPTGVLPIEVPLTDGRRALALPCGNGAFAAYWALDADDKPICVVVDFDAFTSKAWRAKPPRPA